MTKKRKKERKDQDLHPAIQKKEVRKKKKETNMNESETETNTHVNVCLFS